MVAIESLRQGKTVPMDVHEIILSLPSACEKLCNSDCVDSASIGLLILATSRGHPLPKSCRVRRAMAWWRADILRRDIRRWADMPAVFKFDFQGRHLVPLAQELWIQHLKKFPEDWAICPTDMANHPKILDVAWRAELQKAGHIPDRWGEMLRITDDFPTGEALRACIREAYALNAAPNLRPELLNHPEFARARICGLTAYSVRNHKTWKCEPPFDRDPALVQQIELEALRGWPGHGWRDFPPEKRQNPHYVRAAVEGWERSLKQEPGLWAICPEQFRDIEEVKSSSFLGWLAKAKSDPLSWERCPVEFRSETAILDAFAESWAIELARQPWHPCPSDLRQRPPIVRAIREGWRSGAMMQASRRLMLCLMPAQMARSRWPEFPAPRDFFVGKAGG